MGHGSHSSTRGLNGSASGSGHDSDISESNLRGKENSHNDQTCSKKRSIRVGQDSSEEQPFNADEIYANDQTPQAHSWNDEESPCYAQSLSRPIEKYLNDPLGRETFYISGQTTRNADLEHLDPGALLFTMGSSGSAESSSSIVVVKGGKGSNMRTTRGLKESNKAKDTDQEKPLKQEEREKGGARKAYKGQ